MPHKASFGLASFQTPVFSIAVLMEHQKVCGTALGRYNRALCLFLSQALWFSQTALPALSLLGSGKDENKGDQFTDKQSGKEEISEPIWKDPETTVHLCYRCLVQPRQLLLWPERCRSCHCPWSFCLSVILVSMSNGILHALPLPWSQCPHLENKTHEQGLIPLIQLWGFALALQFSEL